MKLDNEFVDLTHPQVVHRAYDFLEFNRNFNVDVLVKTWITW